MMHDKQIHVNCDESRLWRDHLTFIKNEKYTDENKNKN